MSRGKPTVRDISRQSPTKEEREAIREAFASEMASHIVVALLGAAMLEHELEQHLRKRFRKNDDKTWARLNGENGPLGTFAAKINAAHAFGILEEDERHNFLIVKDIRNAFAHSKKLIDFNNPLVMGEFKDVALPAKKKTTGYAQLAFVKNKCDDGRASFVILCFTLSTHLVVKDTKRAEARTRKIKRKLKAKPTGFFGSLLDDLLARDPRSLTAHPGPLGVLFPSADPRALDSPASLHGLLGPLPNDTSSKGKK